MGLPPVLLGDARGRHEHVQDPDEEDRRRVRPRARPRQRHPHLVPRLSPACRARSGAAARPARPHPRRADERPRPERTRRGHPLHPGDRQEPHDPAVDPQPERGRGRLRALDHRLQGPHRRRRSARRDQGALGQGPLLRHALGQGRQALGPGVRGRPAGRRGGDGAARAADGWLEPPLRAPRLRPRRSAGRAVQARDAAWVHRARAPPGDRQPEDAFKVLTRDDERADRGRAGRDVEEALAPAAATAAAAAAAEEDDEEEDEGDEADDDEKADEAAEAANAAEDDADDSEDDADDEEEDDEEEDEEEAAEKAAEPEAPAKSPSKDPKKDGR